MLSMQIDAIEEDIKAKTVCSTERKTIISSWLHYRKTCLGYWENKNWHEDCSSQKATEIPRL
jgi:hypothetical protein